MNNLYSNNSLGDYINPQQLYSNKNSSNEKSIPAVIAAVMGDYFGKHKQELVYYPEAVSQYYAVNYI